jgi:hypothetical protein
VHVRIPLLEQLGHPALVGRMAKSPQQADRGRVHLLGLEQPVDRCGEVFLLQRAEDAVGPRSLRHRDPSLRRHERRGVTRAQPVELGSCLAPQLLEVGEALRREQRSRGHLPLEQCIGAHGHPVHEPLDLVWRRVRGPERGPHRIEDSLGLIARRGRRLGRYEPIGGEQGRVRERAADVDPQKHRWRFRLPGALRRGPQRPGVPRAS